MMKIDFVDLKAQYRRSKDVIDARIRAVLEHGQYIMGPEIGELEERLAAIAGAKYCVGVSDGTTALLIAMMALGIKPGDEVITTPFTFIATGEMIALIGAKPVFVDIDAATYNLDPARIEAAITSKTKAILPVSLYGQCADMDAITAIAGRHGIPVIEDAAQSFGASYKGRRSCGLSSLATTSFFPSKPLGCYGDGGACFTDSQEIAKRMRQISLHGQDRRYHHPVIGLNGRLDTLQAAVVLAKLDTFEEELAARNRVADRYTSLLKEHVKTPYIRSDCVSSFAQYTIQVDSRQQVQAALSSSGVPTAVHYPVPLNMQPVFAHLGQEEGSFPTSDTASRRVLSLPMHAFLTPPAQDYIVEALVRALDSIRESMVATRQ
jgi:UDP-2-acetamido-2-deoxy-ribo-hexuluronate aminotransferase